MSFLYPEYLFFIIPLAIFLYKKITIFKDKIHLIILILLLISLSRPTLDKQAQDTKIKARDIVIALDISYSMRADDIKPNRYEYSKAFIKELLKQNPNDNVMLIVFTTNPLLLSPPTTDHRLIFTALDALNIDYILTKGTSLSKLFKKLKKIDIKQKNLILITDGGDESDAKKLADIIRYETKSFNILAIGSEVGSTIPNKDTTLLKDSESNLVISRLNPMLKNLSNLLDASYIKATSSPQQSAKLIATNIKISDDSFMKKEYKYIELYQFSLFIATILFVLVHTRWIKYLIIFFTFFSLNVDADILDNYYLDSGYKSYKSNEYNNTINTLQNIKDKSLQSQIIKANTLYKMGKYEMALGIYLSIKTTDAKIKKDIYFNIANCFASLLNFNDAKIFYAKSLQLGEDNKSFENLEAVAFQENKSKNDGKTLPKSQQKSKQNGDFQSKNKNSKNGKKHENDVSDTKEKFPISSKTYELINKGYINETKPW